MIHQAKAGLFYAYSISPKKVNWPSPEYSITEQLLQDLRIIQLLDLNANRHIIVHAKWLSIRLNAGRNIQQVGLNKYCSLTQIVNFVVKRHRTCPHDV